ncbi:MAG TPA: potassium-transporting ATPase subunit KdpA, partial [Thermoanaerobaculia bacterium]
RTPESLGKKIEAKDVKLAMLTVLIFAALVLVGSAVASVSDAGRSSVANAGPHGLSEMTYAFTSAAGNNGSAFAGLNANTRFYNIALGLAMFFGRFFMIIPIMGIAGSLAAKKRIPESAGTFPVDGPLFALLLTGVIVIVGALTYFPALSLGPIVEHLLMQGGMVF